MARKRFDVGDLAGSVCRVLDDLGCAYHWEGDNRAGKVSRYFFVRSPVSMKIRVSDHPSERIQKDIERSRHVVMDVGPHAMSLDEFAQQAAATVKAPAMRKRVWG